MTHPAGPAEVGVPLCDAVVVFLTVLLPCACVFWQCVGLELVCVIQVVMEAVVCFCACACVCAGAGGSTGERKGRDVADVDVDMDDD